MKEKTRDIAVGITVILALAILGGLILVFTGLPWYFQRGYLVKIAATSTHDVHPGDAVHLAGMRVGRITDVGFTDPSRPYGGVTITARINEEISLPGNVVAEFYTKGLVGSAWTELKPSGKDLVDPETGRVIEVFPTDGSVTMPSKHIGESMIPPELTDAMGSLTDLAANINELISPQPPTTTRPDDEEPGRGPASVQGTIAKLNRTLDAMSAVLGDAANQENLKVSLANLAKATGAATETMNELKRFASQAAATAEDFSGLADKVIRGAEEVSGLMATVNRVATKMEAGEGTAGKLLGDPELYNSFLEATEQMGLLMAELRQLVEVWRAKGVEIKLK